MSAVFVPERPSRFAPEPASARTPSPRGAPRHEAASTEARSTAFAAEPPAAPEGEPVVTDAPEGYVLFEVGGTTFSVSVDEVREIVRAARLELLPEAQASYGHGVALVDARGRSVPVADLRSDRTRSGDVLLPMWRRHVGLVVDRVLAVQTPRELVPELDEVPAALPSYARGVLRPAEGGAPVLLIGLPDAAELAADSDRDASLRLGADVLAADVPAEAENA